MDVAFRTRKLQRVFNSERELRKKYGERRAAAIMRRLAVLKNAPTLDKVPVTPPNRCHRLTGGRKGQYEPDYAVPPGWVLKECLDAQGITPAELARRSGRPAKLISEIVAGKASIEPKTALQFEKVLGVDADIWLGIEKDFRLHRARAAEEEHGAAAHRPERAPPDGPTGDRSGHRRREPAARGARAVGQRAESGEGAAGVDGK